MFNNTANLEIVKNDNVKYPDMTLICHKCDYKSHQMKDFTKHLLIHQDKDLFKCTYCDYICTSNANLKSHMARHFQERPYKCPHCGYRAKIKTSLRKHISRKHPKEKCYFNCDKCDFKTHDKEILKNHTKRKHLPHQFLCQECNMTFPRKIDLKYHNDTQHIKLFEDENIFENLEFLESQDIFKSFEF